MMKAAPIPAMPAFCAALKVAISTGGKLPATADLVPRAAPMPAGEQPPALAEGHVSRPVREDGWSRGVVRRAGTPRALLQATLLFADPAANERELDLAARHLLLAAGERGLSRRDLLAQAGAFADHAFLLAALHL